jgi:hypothetical protein
MRVVAGVLGNPKAAEQYPNIYPRLMLYRQARYCVLAATRPVFPARCAMKIRRHHGKLIPEGTAVRNPELARTLRRIAARGRKDSTVANSPIGLLRRFRADPQSPGTIRSQI